MNWDAIIIACVTAVPPTLVALAAFIQAMKTHKAVNSRMDELLNVARQAAHSQGTLEEKAAEQQRKGDAAIDRANIASPTGEHS